MVEWPRNSGRFADYTEDEIDQVRELLNCGRPGVHKEVELIHTFKVQFPGSTLRRALPSGEPSRLEKPFPADTAGHSPKED
jgi:hypothetical protein